MTNKSDDDLNGLLKVKDMSITNKAKSGGTGKREDYLGKFDIQISFVDDDDGIWKFF